MKIYRGPNTGRNWTNTDTKNPRNYIGKWRPGAAIEFDGTIQKGGARHTDIGVQIDEADVIALHTALIKHFRKAIEEGKKTDKRIDELEGALLKISSLVTYEKDRAPSTEQLFDAIEEIADHFGYGLDRRERFSSRFKWLKWNSL